MASIAYICDIKMIDYHRLYGHQTMNFWRLTNAKQFTKFKQGDYLFFLAKGSEHPKTREKGIVGYGKLADVMTSSVTKMWRVYGQLNGYESENDFKEAIKKASKQNRLPKTLNGLYLEQVVFFNAPLYLSEIDQTVSRNLESFMYLDKEGVSLTLKVLNKAKDIGINSWQFALDHDLNESTFELDYVETFVSQLVIDYFHNLSTSLRQHKQFLDLHPQFKVVKEIKGVFYQRDKRTCVIPISNTIKDEPFFAIIAKTQLIKSIAYKKGIPITVKLFCLDWDLKKREICEEFDLVFN